MNQLAVLFVFMGNICQSPTAHGVFKPKLMDAEMAHLVKVDPAGRTITTASARTTKSCVTVAFGQSEVNKYFLGRNSKSVNIRPRCSFFLQWRWFDLPLWYPPKGSGITENFSNDQPCSACSIKNPPSRTDVGTQTDLKHLCTMELAL